MKAYLIDPFKRKITETEYDGDFHKIYDIIGNDCTCFDVVRLDHDDGIYVDDEGMLKPGLFSFGLEGREEPDMGIAPLFGRGLVLGCDDESDSTAPKISLKELRRKVRWLNWVTTGGQQ